MSKKLARVILGLMMLGLGAIWGSGVYDWVVALSMSHAFPPFSIPSVIAFISFICVAVVLIILSVSLVVWLIGGLIKAAEL